MEQVLIYSDSLSWGIIPGTRNRLAFEKRWPGVFENTLRNEGRDIRVIENCLNGRRTTWSDPFKSGRNGSEGLSEAIEMNSPLRLVILMLGTNDFQCAHKNDAWHSAQGIAKLVNLIRQSPIEPGMPIPDVLIVAPPKITAPKGSMAQKFKNADKRCIGLASELEKVAQDMSTMFFDSGSVTEASEIDGIHLDEPQHKVLGQAIAQVVISQKVF